MRLAVVEEDVEAQGVLVLSGVENGELNLLEGDGDAFNIAPGLPDMGGLDLIRRCRAQGQRSQMSTVVRTWRP